MKSTAVWTLLNSKESSETTSVKIIDIEHAMNVVDIFIFILYSVKPVAPPKIGSAFPEVPVNRIVSAIELLDKRGVITSTADGFLVPAPDLFTSAKDLVSSQRRDFIQMEVDEGCRLNIDKFFSLDEFQKLSKK